jgi:hypothetical protein
VETESGGPVDVTVDHDGQHLALEAAQWRGLAEMQVVVDPSHAAPDREVDEPDLEEAGDVSVLAPCEPKHQLPNSAGLFLGDGLDPSHGILLAQSRAPSDLVAVLSSRPVISDEAAG